MLRGVPGVGTHEREAHDWTHTLEFVYASVSGTEPMHGVLQRQEENY